MRFYRGGRDGDKIYEDSVFSFFMTPKVIFS